jgi:hypothetical protein
MNGCECGLSEFPSARFQYRKAQRAIPLPIFGRACASVSGPIRKILLHDGTQRERR